MVYYNPVFNDKWSKAVGDYLKVSSKMFSMWAVVLTEVHSCETKVSEDPRNCFNGLDEAVEKAQEFEKFSHEYVMAIIKLRKVLQSY